MAEFVVRLADDRGRVQEQTHAAATADELRSRFTQSGYYVYSVKAKGLLGRDGKKKRVKLETFLVFNQQFLTLIKAGLPILGSLELLARRQKVLNFRAQLEDVASRVKTGESISTAFEAQGGFPIVYTTTLQAGERSGNLEEVLQRFLDFQRVSLSFSKKLKASLVYPALLVIMVVGLMIFLITFVVPQFAKLYDQLGSHLPALTVFLLDLGQKTQSYGVYAAVGGGHSWISAVPLDEDGGGCDDDRSDPYRAAGGGDSMDEIPGGAVCAHAFYVADRRAAACAVA